MPMTSWDRKAELVRNRVRQSDIAKRMDVSRAFVCDIVAGNRRNARVEQAIADAIGKPVDEVFEPRDFAVTVAA